MSTLSTATIFTPFSVTVIPDPDITDPLNPIARVVYSIQKNIIDSFYYQDIKINGQPFTGNIFTFTVPVSSFVLSGTYSDKGFNQSFKYFYNPLQTIVKKSNVSTFLKTETCFVNLPQTSISFIYSFTPPSSNSFTYSYNLTTGSGTSIGLGITTQIANHPLSYSIDVAVQKFLTLLN